MRLPLERSSDRADSRRLIVLLLQRSDLEAKGAGAMRRAPRPCGGRPSPPRAVPPLRGGSSRCRHGPEPQEQAAARAGLRVV